MGQRPGHCLNISRRSRLLALLACTAGLASCGADAEAPTARAPREAEASTDSQVEISSGSDADTTAGAPDEDMPAGGCPWETDALLSHVGAPMPGLVDCGTVLGAHALGDECFVSAMEAGRAVQITFNNCLDCLMLSTYVATPSAGKFYLYREADYYGPDNLRVVRVHSCSYFGAGEGSEASCADPATLYTCTDPLPSPGAL